MDVNVKKVRVESKEAHDGRMILDMSLQTDAMNYPISPMLHTTDHAKRFVAQLAGEVAGLEGVAFQDLSYMIYPHSQGIEVWLRSKRPPNNVIMFVFPGKELADDIRGLGLLDKTGSVVEWDRKRIFAVKAKYGPKVVTQWGNGAKGEYNALAGNAADPKAVGLRDCMDSVNRIAANASNGDTVRIMVFKDGAPDSFYWEIMKRDQRYMNGGIIWHKQIERYRVHT